MNKHRLFIMLLIALIFYGFSLSLKNYGKLKMLPKWFIRTLSMIPGLARF